MRGRAMSVGEPDIEFEDEIVMRRARIVREKLPPSRRGGAAAKSRVNKGQNAFGK